LLRYFADLGYVAGNISNSLQNTNTIELFLMTKLGSRLSAMPCKIQQRGMCPVMTSIKLKQWHPNQLQ
jgi:hypothetical protein